MKKQKKILNLLPREKKQALKILWSRLDRYPPDHPEGVKIKQQIERIEKRK